MKKSLGKIVKTDKIEKWVVFNVLLMLAFLLRSAGYFAPYLPITVNMIVIFALCLSVCLLRANSRALFLFSVALWFFAGFLAIFQIPVWAERTTVYVFESLVLGVILLTWETMFSKQ